MRTVRSHERTAVNLHAARGATRSRSLTSGRDPTRSRRRALPGGRHAARMSAGAVLAALALTAGIGWWLAPGEQPDPSAAPQPGTPELEYTAHTVPTGGITSATAMILAMLIIGAAVIGLLFFGPKTQRRPRRSEAAVRSRPKACRNAISGLLFLQLARGGLGDRHQELEVVLGLLQPVDQQIDGLMRIQSGQHPAQLVQDRGLVRVHQ